MYTTYYIELNSDKSILGYFTRLYDAKYDLVKMTKPGHARIVCLKGQYKYEGSHFYEVTYTVNKWNKPKFKRTKLGIWK